MSTSLLPKSNFVSVALLLVVIASLYLVFFSEDTEKNRTSLLTINGTNTHASEIEVDTNDKTIATAWQWESPTNTNKEISSSTFSEQAVYSALQRVRLDSQNNVIVDHEALIALNATLDDSRLQLDEQALSELQLIIKQGLPGNAGDDVAKIVTDYYHYLEASKEFNALYETEPSTSQAIETTTEEHEENYRELITLRELYLGSDTSSKLFSTSDANANYMFDMLKIEQATNLSDEEKQQQRTEIMERHTEQTINVSNWDERHGAFLAAKQNIITASISDEEKKTQITELMHQHFNSEELANVSHLQLDKP
jgi:lipase chaperone LimK